MEMVVSLDPHRRPLRGLLRSRRGSASLFFASSALILMGGIALATDAGVFYAARRSAQLAADNAAVAAAVTLSLSGPDAAKATVLDVASRNGFAHGGAIDVAVHIPPRSGRNVGDPTAVEVVIRQQQALGASALFLSSAPTVQGRSVGTLRSNSDVCILALTGKVEASGSAAFSAPNCIIASNMRGTGGIDASGGDIEAYSLSTVGSCAHCSGSNVRLTERYAEWQPPASNPFERLDTKVLPRASGAGCINPNGQLTNIRSFEASRALICGDIKLTGSQVLSLTPGTYYIHNGSLEVQSGTVNCPTCTGGAGVTIVLTGDPARIGGISISQNGSADLRAPRLSADPDYNGVLFFRDPRATTNNTGNPPVSIGSSNLTLRGGMYFPGSHVRITGSSNVATCSVLVAGSIQFTGNAGVTNCAETGTPLPRTRSAVIAE